MRSMTVSKGQAELAVTTWGSSGIPIVALHPGVGDSRIWQWCAPAWVDAGSMVVAYDRRGFGETRWVAEPHSDLGDLLAVLASAVAQPVVVVGNSKGGGLALDLALARPDLVAGLVLIAPSPSGYPADSWVEAPAETEQDTLIEQADEGGDVDLVNRLEVRYWLDGVDQPEGRVEGPPRDLMLDMNGRALRAEPIGEAEDGPPVWPRLAQIDMPTLILVGEHDLPGEAELCRQLVDAMPRAELVTIPGSAHCPSLDQPEPLNRLVIDFVGTIWNEGGWA